LPETGVWATAGRLQKLSLDPTAFNIAIRWEPSVPQRTAQSPGRPLHPRHRRFMNRNILTAALALMLWALLSPARSVAEESPRIALIIGNSEYVHAPLANPVNDANLVAGTLKELGFQVLQHNNVSQKELKLAVRQFGDALEKAGRDAVGLFYYSGHGIQFNGRNYMLPVNADLRRESDIDIEGVAADIVLGTMEFARNRLNMVIMDACRNNPFARSFRSASRGLARMDATKGTLIAYSTSPGMVAADGSGRNSPYTRALAASMQQPGLAVEQMFKEVRRAVMAETNDLQVPWESSSLTGDFYFAQSGDSAPVIAAPAPQATSNDTYAEVAFWESIKDSQDPSVFRAYMDQFPDGVFRGLAEIRQRKLADQSPALARGNTVTPTPIPTPAPVPARQPQQLTGAAATQSSNGVTLSAPASIVAGSPLEVTWAGPDNKRDMITIVPRDADKGAYGNYRYTKEGKPLKLLAPDEPGSYELRYLLGSDRTALASLPVVVSAASATLAAPAEASAGDEIKIAWEGPDNPRDMITIVERSADAGRYGSYVYTEKGTPVKLQAPDSPGDYEIRYLTGQSRKSLTERPLKVVAVSASIEAPSTVSAGSEIKFQWQGPDNKRDFITIVEADADSGKYGNYVYTSKGNPLKLRAPETAGSYEIRYLTGQSKSTLFSRPLTVTATSATLEAPQKVTAGAEFKVQWTGPDNQKDFLTIVEVDAEEKKYGNYRYTSKGSPLTLQAPDVPGNYEIRYLTGQSRLTLASRAIEVEAATARLQLPSSVQRGAEFKVEWEGPDNPRDFITIVPADTEEGKYAKYGYTKKGSPLTLSAPGQPGDYEVRYLMGQTRRTLTSQPIRVE
jgi:hypothetical protein